MEVHGRTRKQPDIPDIKVMRADARKVLDADALLIPRYDELVSTSNRLRGHIEQLIPAVENLAGPLPDEDTARLSAAAAIENAQVRLTASAGSGLMSTMRHTRSLARELHSLCDHYATLTGLTARRPA